MSIERYTEVKNLIKQQIQSLQESNVVLIEGSKLMSFVNALSYHYCLIEGQLNNVYTNQYIDTVNNESDLISLCEMIGYVRSSKVPNSITLNTLSTARNNTHTGTKKGVSYTFRSLCSGSNIYYEGSFQTWNVTSSKLVNSRRCKLTNSENLFVAPNSLVVTLNGVQLKACEEISHYFNTAYYYIVENSDGNYSIQTFSDGSLVVSGFLVGTKESNGIRFSTGSTNPVTYSISGGYSEKEGISAVRSKFPSIVLNNDRAITINDYNLIGKKLFPGENLFFFEDNTDGVVYFSNKGESELSASRCQEIIDTYEARYMITGLRLKYKRLNPIVWYINIECLLTTSDKESEVRESIDDYFANIDGKLSLFEFMQTMYNKHAPGLVDIKVNNSYIKIPVINERMIDLRDKRGVISFKPYMEHTISDNKVYFIASYTGEVKISNVLSEVTYVDGDYITYSKSVDFRIIRRT